MTFRLYSAAKPLLLTANPAEPIRHTEHSQKLEESKGEICVQEFCLTSRRAVIASFAQRFPCRRWPMIMHAESRVKKTLRAITVPMLNMEDEPNT